VYDGLEPIQDMLVSELMMGLPADGVTIVHAQVGEGWMGVAGRGGVGGGWVGEGAGGQGGAGRCRGGQGYWAEWG
jgi:hypothetical protein